MQQQLLDLQALVASLQAQLARASAPAAIITHAVEKPQTFSGDDAKTRSEDARRFLAAFQLYAMMVPTLTNPNNGSKDETAWIRSFLGFLKGEAAIWATPHHEEFAEGKLPFNGRFADLVKAFKNRFEILKPEVAARKALQQLYQKGLDIPTYTARF